MPFLHIPRTQSLPALTTNQPTYSYRYGHTHLPSLDYASIVNEMGALESLFRNIIGVVPTYMRPPFLAVDGRVLAVMAELGYKVIGASVDTKDFENNDPWLIYESVRRFVDGVDAGGSIVLAHDTHAQTVFTLTRAMLEEVARRGLFGKTFFSLFFFLLI